MVSTASGCNDGSNIFTKGVQKGLKNKNVVPQDLNVKLQDEF